MRSQLKLPLLFYGKNTFVLKGRRQKALMNELLFSSINMRKNSTFAGRRIVLMSALKTENVGFIKN